MKVEVLRTNRNVIEMKMSGNVVSVTANKRASLDDIKKAVIENYPKLVANSSRQRDDTQTSCFPSDRAVADCYAGKTALLFGEFCPVAPTGDKKTQMSGGTLLISEAFFEDRQLRLAEIRKYVKKSATLHLGREIAECGSRLSLCPSAIRLRSIRGTDWLICASPDKQLIVLDYRIVQLPRNLREYVILHAFAHFVVGDHGDVFRRFLQSHLPTDIKSLQSELDSYSFVKDI